MSADLLPSETPGEHYQGDARDLMGESWDLVIAHPPCTYLANSGVQWLGRPGRRDLMSEGAAFFADMFEWDSPRICVENPIQHRYAREAHGQGKPTQYIQPWQYGQPESKKTGLWLRGLPPLTPTNNVHAEMMQLSPGDRQPVWYASPGPDRWKARSRTIPGIADAMAEQWGGEL